MYQNLLHPHIGAVRVKLSRLWLTALAMLGAAALQGCETDGFLDPSRTGYFEFTPATMPVLERLDVIEPPEEPLGVTGPPEPQDLVSNALQYRLAPGDVIVVEIYELINEGRTEAAKRIVDPGGLIRLPTINEVRAGGLTLEELREEIRKKLEPFIRNPVITVDIEQGRSFEFTIQGAVQNPGVYALDKPGFRLTQALALANGAEAVTERVLVIRSMRTEQDVQDAANASTQQAAPTTDQHAPANPAPPARANPQSTPVDIEELIKQLGTTGTVGQPTTPAAPVSEPPSAPAPTPAPAPAPTPAPAPAASEPVPAPSPPAPGAVSGAQSAPAIDVDSLEAISVHDAPGIDAATLTQRAPASQLANGADAFVFDVNSQQWVRIKAGKIVGTPSTISAPMDGDSPSSGVALTGDAARANATGGHAKSDPRAIFNTRIIEVDYERLVRGDQSQNVVVRPGDEIFVAFPPLGVVYIDGEIQRPGVFQLPSAGRLTLSRLVASAGGLTQIAIPERVDLVRRLPGGRQASIRVNLAAIRKMSEPDIVLHKDDHVIIGTNFWATPLAVIRNGFRMTYGFGFLLDRNWGNDVFGPPPMQETVNF